MLRPPPEPRTDRLWGESVSMRSGMIGSQAGDGLAGSGECLGPSISRCSLSLVVDEGLLSVDCSMQIAPPRGPAPGRRFRPTTRSAASLGLGAPPQFAGQDQCELRLPLSYRLVAEQDAAPEDQVRRVP